MSNSIKLVSMGGSISGTAVKNTSHCFYQFRMKTKMADSTTFVLIGCESVRSPDCGRDTGGSTGLGCIKMKGSSTDTSLKTHTRFDSYCSSSFDCDITVTSQQDKPQNFLYRKKRGRGFTYKYSNLIPDRLRGLETRSSERVCVFCTLHVTPPASL